MIGPRARAVALLRAAVTSRGRQQLDALAIVLEIEKIEKIEKIESVGSAGHQVGD